MSSEANNTEIAAKMDMALDDIIKEKKTNFRRQRGGRRVGNRGRGGSSNNNNNTQRKQSVVKNVFNRGNEARTDRISQLRGIPQTSNSNTNNTARRRGTTGFLVRNTRTTWASQQRQREANRRKKEQSYRSTANNPFAVKASNQNNQIRVNVSNNNKNPQTTQRKPLRGRGRSVAQAATLRSRAVNQSRKANAVNAMRGIQTNNNSNNTNAQQTLNERFSAKRTVRGGAQRGRGTNRRGSRRGRGISQQTGPRTVSITL